MTHRRQVTLPLLTRCHSPSVLPTQTRPCPHDHLTTVTCSTSYSIPVSLVPLLPLSCLLSSSTPFSPLVPFLLFALSTYSPYSFASSCSYLSSDMSLFPAVPSRCPSCLPLLFFLRFLVLLLFLHLLSLITFLLRPVFPHYFFLPSLCYAFPALLPSAPRFLFSLFYLSRSFAPTSLI